MWERNEPAYIYRSESENQIDLGKTIIGRYFNLSGFLNMLETSELCFKKISEFEDKAEGVPLYEEIKKGIEKSRKYVGSEYAQEREKNTIKTIENYYASCWIMKDHESYLMWKNYTNFHEGILVLTTVNELISSLEIKCYESYSDGERPSICENWFYGEVDYNYEKEPLSDHHRAFGKSKYFSDENEFRLVIYRHPVISEAILRRSIKDFSFIKSIVCSPKATREFIDLVKKIVENYSLQGTLISESEMKQNNRDIFHEFIYG